MTGEQAKDYGIVDNVISKREEINQDLSKSVKGV